MRRQDYPNMSYTAFRNTSLGMDQLIGMMEVAVEKKEPLYFTTYDEQKAFEGMLMKAEELIDQLEEYQRCRFPKQEI